jgi:hypothetical protein
LYTAEAEKFHLCAHDYQHETQGKETCPVGKGYLRIMQNNNSSGLSGNGGAFLLSPSSRL